MNLQNAGCFGMSLHAGRIKFGNGAVPTIQQHLSPLALNLRYHGSLLCARLWLRSRSCPGAYSSYLVARPVSTGGLVGASLWTRVVDWYRPGVAPAVLWVSWGQLRMGSYRNCY